MSQQHHRSVEARYQRSQTLADLLSGERPQVESLGDRGRASLAQLLGSHVRRIDTPIRVCLRRLLDSNCRYGCLHAPLPRWDGVLNCLALDGQNRLRRGEPQIRRND